VERIAAAIKERKKRGSSFSIVAVAEGAMSSEDSRAFASAEKKLKRASSLEAKLRAKQDVAALELRHQGNTIRLAHELEALTELEARVTILGHVQRGGSPSAADRILATRLGSACAELINDGRYGVMVASQGDAAVPVPLEEVAGKLKLVPVDHCWVNSARRAGTCLGD
jgi:6-phosphofructokinase 1